VKLTSDLMRFAHRLEPSVLNPQSVKELRIGYKSEAQAAPMLITPFTRPGIDRHIGDQPRAPR
jgi:hypothetical protein